MFTSLVQLEGLTINTKLLRHGLLEALTNLKKRWTNTHYSWDKCTRKGRSVVWVTISFISFNADSLLHKQTNGNYLKIFIIKDFYVNYVFTTKYEVAHLKNFLWKHTMSRLIWIAHVKFWWDRWIYSNSWRGVPYPTCNEVKNSPC